MTAESDSRTRRRGPARAPAPPGAHHELVVALVASGRTHEAAAEVIKVNGARVRAYLRALLRDGDDADDAFSTFAEWTCRGIGRFRNEGPVAAWALGVARNAARKVREERRRVEPLREDDLARLVLERDYHLGEDLELAALRLEAVRATLPDRDRTLLRLRLDRRLRWKDIAELLASQGAPITSMALRKRFERIKSRMGLLARDLGPLG